MKPSQLEYYYRFQAPVYDFTRQFFLFNRRRAIAAMQLQEGEKVLDLGCGTGLNFPLIRQMAPSADITGVDYCRAMLKQARKKHRDIRLLHADVSSDMSELLQGERFDKVIAAYSISMIDRWQEAIINVKKIMHQNSGQAILIYCDLVKRKN